MEQERADGKVKGTPRKKSWVMSGCLHSLIGVLLGLVLWAVGPYPFPLDAMPIEGTVVVLDENGEAIPFQPTRFTSFSHFAPGFFHSELKRTRTFRVNETGKFSRRIPPFATTLLFFTEDGKHAAVVEIRPAGLPRRTDLTIELRPRYTVTGRLLNRSGTPIANHKITLRLMSQSDRGKNLPWSREFSTVNIFHSEATTTDSEGFFTIDNVIPGVEYALSSAGLIQIPLEMPILEPEQYQEPFDLGDVSPPVLPRCC